MVAPPPTPPAITTTSNYLLGQLFELVIAVDEIAPPSKVTIDPDYITGNITINMVIPGVISNNGNEIKIKAAPYYPITVTPT